MVGRAWASLGVAVLLGAAGCTSEQVEAPGIEEEGTPTEDPGEVVQEPPPVTEQDACLGPDLSRMPAEGIVDAWPGLLACELSPDACDALRPAHARRSIPRPCQLRDTTPGSGVAYTLVHEADGRLAYFDSDTGAGEGFAEDDCRRPAVRVRDVGGGSSRYSYESWRHGPEGQLLERYFETNFFKSTLTVERDARGWPTGATLQPRYGTEPLAPVRHKYTLDAEGRIIRATGTSLDVDGDWSSEQAWEEMRRYDAVGTLTEVRRSTPEGQLLWLKELSRGRLVRYVSQRGLRTERWTYSNNGQLSAYTADTSDDSGLKEQVLVEYAYGAEDGRLLGIDRTTRQRRDGSWSESSRSSTYRYAEDGRILFRVDHLGSFPEAPSVTYPYDYVCP